MSRREAFEDLYARQVDAHHLAARLDADPELDSAVRGLVANVATAWAETERDDRAEQLDQLRMLLVERKLGDYEERLIAEPCRGCGDTGVSRSSAFDEPDEGCFHCYSAGPLAAVIRSARGLLAKMDGVRGAL